MLVHEKGRSAVMLFTVMAITFSACSTVLAQKKPKPGDSEPPPAPPPVVRYYMTLLGTLGGPTSHAADMNTWGAIVGMADTAETFTTSDGRLLFRSRPFLNVGTGTARTMIDLQARAEQDDVVKAPLPERGEVVRWELRSVNAINDHGQIVGWGHLYDANGTRSPRMLWRLTLPADGPGLLEDCGSAPDSSPIRINNDGDIILRAFVDGVWTVFLYTDEHKLISLGTFDGTNTFPVGLTSRVNGALQIAGSAGQKTWRMQATISPSGVTASAMQDIGGMFSRDQRTSAGGMNESGQIVGQTIVSRDTAHAYRYTPGSGFQDLGTLAPTKTWDASTGNALNNLLGDVVGSSKDGTSTSQPTLYRNDLGLVNLISLVENFDLVKEDLGGQPGDSFAYAINPRDINDAGQICGPWVDNFYNYTGQAWILNLIQ